MRSVQYGDDQKYWFVTAPAADSRDPVRLWVIGDSGQPGEIANAVRDSMKIWVNDHPRENRTAIDQWILLGDNAYRSGSNQQYQVALFDTYPSILRNFAFWPAYGNHDARRWTFFDIFSLPEKAEAGGRKSGTEHYYSFNYGNIHIIMLDSQDSGREPGDRMLRWLEKDLNEAEQQWKIVVFHHPPYSKGSHDSDDKGDSGGRMMEMRSNVLPILEKYDVDLVLSGHSHGYERSRMIACHYGPSSEFSEANVVSSGLDQQHQRYLKASKAGNGTLYVVAGASSKVDYAEMNHPAMAVSKKEAGSLLIDIEGNVLTGRYINAKAAVIDEFSIEKQADYTSGFAGCV